MKPGAIVLLHLVEPVEKYWGVIEDLGAHGLTLRGINLQSFDDWMLDFAADEAAVMGPATIFFPLRRVECMFLDERIGQVISYSERFEARAGVSAREALGSGSATEGASPTRA